MPETIIEAFQQFMQYVVNLDPQQTALARASRGWLLDQVHFLPTKHADFPILYPDVDIDYGSFARRTKIRELDDVDLIVGVSALGSMYYENGTSVEIRVPEGTVLRGLCHTDSNALNSRRVINRLIARLSDVPQYENAKLTRNGAAAVLKLKSYPWTYDIVPAFFTSPESDGRTYYLIPDEAGGWMKTDPRIDGARAANINTRHGGNVLNAIRLVKYWNRRPTMPSIEPYVLETAILDYYDQPPVIATQWADVEFGRILPYLSTTIFGPIHDAKGLQGDLNTLPFEQRIAVSLRASDDAQKAAHAHAAEKREEFRTAFRLWQEILGPAFPAFG